MKYKLSIPSNTLSGLELKYVSQAISENEAATGRFIGLFEESVKKISGASFAHAVSNGTSAIHLALLALGVGRGDLVFASSFTFIGSVSPVVYTGAEPFFIDSSEETWNMDPNLLEDELKKRAHSGGKMPKALILTHIYGQPADMDAICGLCEKYGVILVEDAAESLGAVYDGRQTGTFGKVGIYSFNANKIVTSAGGGMLVSEDENLLKKTRYFANQAKENAEYYEHLNIGYNYRLSNIQSAYGYAQMQELESRIESRKKIFEFYKSRLEGLPVVFMPEHSKASGTRWLTAVVFDDEDKESIYDYMSVEGVETRSLWKPMHMQPVFKDCGARVNGTSENLFKYGLCLPSCSDLTEENLLEIIEKLSRIL